MGWFNRITERFREEDEIYGENDDHDHHVNQDLEEDVEPSTPLGKLMERVLGYREDELRDLRARAYKSEGELAKVEHDLSFATYHKNEALGRLAKVYEILNARQRKQLEKSPIELRFGPPPLQMHVFDEKALDYRRVDVPPPAKMETIRRKGTQDKPVTVFNADRKTRQSNLDNEREQATLQQSKRRGK
jgi:hypothetical protein